jgi:serine phosphatase RsbU (regulator of sigma subunit)/type II secretory pathway pseudopilin PulG
VAPGLSLNRRQAYDGRSRLAIAIVLLGGVVTAVIVLTAWTSNRNNEHRLLQVQTRQAADVISSAFLGIEGPLATALQVARATGGAPAPFRRSMSAYVGPKSEFVSASLWEKTGSTVRQMTSLGATPELAPGSPQAARFVAGAFRTTTVAVTGLPAGPQPLRRVVYALANIPGSRFAVYAERAIPANRQVSVESGQAFADLDFATYLGTQARTADLATTDVPQDSLPLKGYTVRDAIPFGDTTLTLVAGARGELGGTLSRDLPWIFAAGGILLTLAAALVADRLSTRRREAEHNAAALAALYEQVGTLYGEQRTIAEALQQALLPRTNPSIPNLEIATRYVAGTAGVDIGGDWYSTLLLDDRHFAFVIGDVSGRGIDAASIMARLRFTIRAYLVEGHSPATVLEMCSHQLDIESDGHFATVLVGIGDLETRRIVLANAGHLKPIVISGETTEFVETSMGMPLGFDAGDYPSTAIVMPPASTFLAFTDGLVERRGEGIDAGFERLAEAATEPAATLEALLDGVVARVVPSETTDDLAILAFRWIDT